MANPVPVKATILIVSDNDDFRGIARDVLAVEGYDVATASDGLEALELLSSGTCRPDLVVSDVYLPRLDGIQLYGAVRAIPALEGMPFLLLKDDRIMPASHFGSEPGEDDYLYAPFDVGELLAAVKSKLRRARGESDP